VPPADPDREGSASQPQAGWRHPPSGKGRDGRELSGGRQPENRLRRTYLRKIHHRSLPGMGGFRTADLYHRGNVLTEKNPCGAISCDMIKAEPASTGSAFSVSGMRLRVDVPDLIYIHVHIHLGGGNIG